MWLLELFGAWFRPATTGQGSCVRGTSTGERLSEEEMALLCERVRRLLFARGVDKRTSFRVCERGIVVIKICQAIPDAECALLVQRLQADPLVRDVWAEKGGVKVTCG